MADFTLQALGRFNKRYKDMGDGTHSEVVVSREIKTVTVTVPTVGGAGVAVGSVASAAIAGDLIDIKLDYDATSPATTDVTVSDAYYGTILTVTDSATDGVYRPAAAVCDNTGTPIANAYERITLNGAVTVAVAQCDALAAAVVATIRYVTP